MKNKVNGASTQRKRIRMILLKRSSCSKREEGFNEPEALLLGEYHSTNAKTYLCFYYTYIYFFIHSLSNVKHPEFICNDDLIQ